MKSAIFLAQFFYSAILGLSKNQFAIEFSLNPSVILSMSKDQPPVSIRLQGEVSTLWELILRLRCAPLRMTEI